ncbi:M20/M25/M40 family metallo-hydrolase, partial [Intestinibacter sp.]
MNKFLKRAQELESSIKKDRHFLHQNAELGDDLPVTTKYVMERLQEIGLEPKEICKSGITALIKGNKPGKTYLLRADMDALDMNETNDLEFKSKTKAAHNCGHDMHTSMLLAAAQILNENKDELEGNVRLMFQPN